MAKSDRRRRQDGSTIVTPDRHHGGQELPDDVQDRPEQNAGYDAAVRGDTGTALSPEDDAGVIDLDPDTRDADLSITSELAGESEDVDDER